MRRVERRAEIRLDDFDFDRLMKIAPYGASLQTETDEEGRYLSRDPETGLVVSQWAARQLARWRRQTSRKRRYQY